MRHFLKKGLSICKDLQILFTYTSGTFVIMVVENTPRQSKLAEVLSICAARMETEDITTV